MSDSFSHRDEIIANLRAMADLFEQNPGMPVPWSVYMATYTDNMEVARSARRGVFGWKKEASPTTAHTDYNLSIGGNEYGMGSVTYAISVTKADTCKRVQVGTKHIEAQDIPVYEWDCGSDTTESDTHEAKVIENHTNTIG